MKTTLNIDGGVITRLRQEAARQGRTMSELVEAALRTLLATERERRDLPPQRTFHSGGALVDVASRSDLSEAMGGR